MWLKAYSHIQVSFLSPDARRVPHLSGLNRPRAKSPDLVAAIRDNTSADFATAFVATNRGCSGLDRRPPVIPGLWLPTSKEAAVPQKP